jgi:ribosomal-protein-alanine N-acetyltransferase
MRFVDEEPLIVTERLIVAPARRGDFADWSHLRTESRAHLEPFEPRWPPDAHSKADWDRRLKAWQTRWKDGSAFVFLIRLQADETLVGGCSLTQVRPWPSSAATLGYWLGARYQKQGYMQEAVEAVCDWAFSERGLCRIEAATLPDNLRSQSVLQRAGFAREGYAKSYIEIDGTRRDHVLFARLNSP